MKIKVILVFVILVINSCFGVTIQFRKGGDVKGEIVSKGREEFVLKTTEGEKTFKWRQIKSSCIKEVYPELFEKLKAEAIERKKKKNEKIEGEKAADFSKVAIEITTTEKSGTFKKEKTDKKNKLNRFSKINQGILKIKFQWLDKSKTYNLKTIFTHHLKYREKFGNSYQEARPSDKDKEIVENIKNVTSFEKKYFSSPYHGYKIKTRKGYHFPGAGGKTKSTFGYESDGWDISLFLNDKLIYKEEKGEDPEYFIVRKL